MNEAVKFDKITAIVILVLYLLVNVWFIWQAKKRKRQSSYAVIRKLRMLSP
jgi:hypothetical protein